MNGYATKYKPMNNLWLFVKSVYDKSDVLIQQRIYDYCTSLNLPTFSRNTLVFFFVFLTLIDFWDTKTAWAGEVQRERGRHRIWSRLQAPCCQHRAWPQARTHKRWDHDLSRSWSLNRLSHSGAPVNWFSNSAYQMNPS